MLFLTDPDLARDMVAFWTDFVSAFLAEILARRLTRTTEMLGELEAAVPRAQRRELQDFRSKLLTDWSF